MESSGGAAEGYAILMRIVSRTRRRCEKMSSCIGFWSSGSFTGSPMVALSIIRAVVLSFRVMR